MIHAPMEDILSDLDCPISDEDRIQWAAEIRAMRRKIQEQTDQLQADIKAMNETSEIVKTATSTINYLNAENQVLRRKVENK